jgi:hypothetical protein
VVNALRIPLIAATLILSISAPSFAQEWTEYVNQADLFGVNFPGQPAVKEIAWESEYGVTLPGRVYSVDAEGARYSVTVIDFTTIGAKHAEKLKACRAGDGEGDQCMDRAYLEVRGAPFHAAWTLMEKAAKVTHLVYAQVDLIEGIEVHLNNPDRSRTLATVLIHENRLYILNGTVPAGAPEPLLFQQTLRFIDKEGKSIRYQSTYTNGFPVPPRSAR